MSAPVSIPQLLTAIAPTVVPLLHAGIGSRVIFYISSYMNPKSTSRLCSERAGESLRRVRMRTPPRSAPKVFSTVPPRMIFNTLSGTPGGGSQGETVLCSPGRTNCGCLDRFAPLPQLFSSKPEQAAAEATLLRNTDGESRGLLKGQSVSVVTTAIIWHNSQVHTVVFEV